MMERDDAALIAAKKSWRIRRRIKRLFLGWFLVSLVFAEAGISWFGILIARNAPMSLADATVLGERFVIGFLAALFLLMIVAMAFQFRSLQRLRRIEKIHAERMAWVAAQAINP